MWSVKMCCCRGRWIFLVPLQVHGGIVGGSRRLVTRSRPVPLLSQLGRSTVLWRPLFHLPRILLWMHSVGPRRLDSRHGHVPALPLAELHLPFLPLSFLPLPIRHVPLLFILHQPDGTLRVVFLGWPQLFPVGVHLGWRPTLFDLPLGANTGVLLWRTDRTGRDRATRHPSLSGLLRHRQRRAPLGV